MTDLSHDLPRAPTAAPDSSMPDAAEAQTRLLVRRLLIDLSTGFDELWCGGDPFRTHYMNALSMSFPVGEQFFIDSVRAGMALLPADKQQALADDVRGFSSQEVTHRFLHAQFNAELERQGLVNHWERWGRRHVEKGRKLHPINNVAVTAAYEHFTAAVSTGLLTHPHWLEGAPADLALLWRWHAVEESEHKAVAFDVYRAMGGGEARRILWFACVGLALMVESLLQTFINLWSSGQWRRPRTWWCGAKFLLGPGGVWRVCLRPLLRYLRPGFHPNHLDNAAELAQWLQTQRDAYSIVGR